MVELFRVNIFTIELLLQLEPGHPVSACTLQLNNEHLGDKMRRNIIRLYVMIFLADQACLYFKAAVAVCCVSAGDFH